MNFGVARETRPRERRVGLTPTGAAELVSAGHSVLVEAGAGDGAGFADDYYLAAGADVMWNVRDLVANADVVVKVQAPTPEEDLLGEGRGLVAFLHPASAPVTLHEALQRRRTTAIALELVEEDDGERPVVDLQVAIGARVAINIAASRFLAGAGGTGRLIGGAPGVPPLHVVVLGAGTAGEAAAREAVRMAARVTVIDRDPRVLTRLLRRLPGVATAMARDHHLARLVQTADLLVGAVAVHGHRAPKVLTRRHIRQMPPGAMFVDLAIDEGGCSETSRLLPDLDGGPSELEYEDDGVRHICIPNLASEVAETASRAISNTVIPYLLELGEHGMDAAITRVPALDRGTVYLAGELRNPVVRKALAEAADREPAAR